LNVREGGPPFCGAAVVWEGPVAEFEVVRKGCPLEDDAGAGAREWVIRKDVPDMKDPLGEAGRDPGRVGTGVRLGVGWKMAWVEDGLPEIRAPSSTRYPGARGDSELYCGGEKPGGVLWVCTGVR